MQPLVFEKIRFVFQEKSGHSHILALSAYNIFDSNIFSGNIGLELYSVDRKLLIETMMEEMEKVILRRVKSVYQDN